MSAAPTGLLLPRARTPTTTIARTDARLRMLLLTDTAILGPGGSERFLRNLLEGLDPGRYAIDVVQLAPPPAQPVPLQPPAGARIRLAHWPVDAIYGMAGLRLYRTLRRRLLRDDYDLVQSQHEKSDLLAALLPRGPTQAVRISNRRDTGFQKSPRLRHAFRLLNGRFDWIVAPSHAVLEHVARDEGLRAARTLALPNGVDTARFAPLAMERRLASRRALGLAPEHFAFGCVARLVAVKRHRDLLEAFVPVAAVEPDARLVLVGGGPLEAELRARAAHAGIASRIVWLGERGDVEGVLPLLDAFVLCSETEGMSNAIVEAMACGLPVVATAVGGNPEVVEPDRTGALVPPAAPAQLAIEMHRLLQDRARSVQLGRTARMQALARHSLAAMVARYERLYRDACPAWAAR